MSNDYVMIPVKKETRDKLKILKSNNHHKNMDVTVNELLYWYYESKKSNME